MYKGFFGLLLFILGLSFTFAQGIQSGEGTKPYSLLNDIQLRFCNEGLESSLLKKQGSVELNSGEKKDFCMVFFNETNQDLSVGYGYGYTKASPGGYNCQGDLGTGQFANMFSKIGEDKLIIPANSYKVIYNKMFLPPGLSGGIVHGCVSFWSNDEKISNDGGMFAIQVRKAARVDVLINGRSNIESLVYLGNQKSKFYVTNKKVRAINSGDELILSILVVNSGNIVQIFNVNGMIYNFLGFQRKFSLENEIIGPYQTRELFLNMGILPNYKGLFNVSIDATNTPSIMYEISLDENEITGGNFHEEGKLFVFSWIQLIISLLVILFLYKLFKPRRVKVLSPNQQ